MALIASLFGNVAHAAGAIGSLGPEVAKQLGAVPAGAVVVASPLVSDSPALKGDELSVRVAAVIAGGLGASARAHGQAVTLPMARAIAGKSGALVYVQVEIAKGELRATADVYPVMSNGWDRIRAPQPPPRAHAFAHGAVDAEVRTFLPSITLERAAVHKAKHDEGDVLAVACGDVDGDGGMELVLVSRARVAIGHLVGEKFAPTKSVAWSALAPRAPVPLRDPLGGASVGSSDGRGVVRVGITDRSGVALDASLVRMALLRGIPVPIGDGASEDACAIANAEESAFEGDVTACANATRDVTVRVTPPIARYDAAMGMSVVAKDGTSKSAFAAREPSAKLRLRVGDAVRVIDGVGAQVALGDLDQDGQLEVVTTANEGDDAITIATWDGATEPRARMKIAAPAGVRALAVCPPEVRAAPALVAIVGGEVWLVR